MKSANFLKDFMKILDTVPKSGIEIAIPTLTTLNILENRVGFPRGNYLRIAVVSCRYIFLASGFPALGRVLIPSSAELSGLNITHKPLICINPLARISGATQGLPNPHQYEFTEVSEVLNV